MADDRLIAALDVPTRAAAEQLVTRLGDSVSCYKVGMELFYALGGDIVTWLKGREKKVFLDLKLHDIPNTVANGLCSLLRLRPDILNVHTAGGLRMMKTAVEALHAAADREGVPCPKLIGVTVLTSMDAEDWGGLGHTGRPAGVAHDDQRRVMTPAGAIRAGASQIVVGRAIYAAENPRAAAEEILKEMESV